VSKKPATAPSSRRIQTRRSGVHGKGVFAVQDIAAGETLIEYVGEIISWDEAQERHPHDPKDPNHTFLLPCRRGPRHRCSARRQLVAVDQPQLRPQLRSR
jgi:hypothetical protein